MLTTRAITNAGAPLCAPDGTLLPNTSILFELVNTTGARADAWDAVTSERVGGDPITVTTDEAGEFSVDLWPNSRGDRITRYRCTVQHTGFRPFSGVVEDAGMALPWVNFMTGGIDLAPQEISQLSQYLADIEAAKVAAEAAAGTAPSSPALTWAAGKVVSVVYADGGTKTMSYSGDLLAQVDYARPARPVVRKTFTHNPDGSLAAVVQTTL